MNGSSGQGHDHEAASAPVQVERTGIALVHQGEWIVPDEGAAALLGPQEARMVQYWFPVEVEVLGGASGELAGEVWAALARELEGFA